MFTRDYDQRWSGELFPIVKKDGSQKYPTYTIKDYGREPIDGAFYDEELQKVTPNEHYKGHPKEVLMR